MSKHTPGPWVYGPEFSVVMTRDKQGTVAILLPLGHTRDDEDIDTEMMDAHGRLLAAAPELLEFVQYVAKGIPVGDDPCSLEELEESLDHLEERAKRLVAKIEGDEGED